MRVTEKHMDLLTEHTTSALLNEQQPPCVSLFLPTARKGPEAMQGPIRLKNLVRQAAAGLNSAGVDEFAKNEVLAPARDLIKQEEFWRYQSDGLAVFLSRGHSWVLRLPLEFEEMVSVDERFYLRPLIPLLSLDGHFFLLALSQGNMRLLEATRHQVGQIALQEVPESLMEFLRIEGQEAALRKHTQRDRAITDAGMRSEAKDRIVEYFRLVDHNVRDLLKHDRAPLLLAGLDHMQGLYRMANKYPHLLAEGVTGNPDELTEEELQQRAWDIVAPIVLKERADAIARYEHLQGKKDGHATDRLEMLVPASKDGRIDTLFVRKGARAFGHLDSSTHEVTLHDSALEGDEELINYSVLETLRHRGKVYRFANGELGDDSVSCAAVLRY